MNVQALNDWLSTYSKFQRESFRNGIRVGVYECSFNDPSRILVVIVGDGVYGYRVLAVEDCHKIDDQNEYTAFTSPDELFSKYQELGGV